MGKWSNLFQVPKSKRPDSLLFCLSVFELPPLAERFTMPAVIEPFIAWAASGDAEFQEREHKGAVDQ